jgi:hypothetical protein
LASASTSAIASRAHSRALSSHRSVCHMDER